jgi:hypothetical protein
MYSSLSKGINSHGAYIIIANYISIGYYDQAGLSLSNGTQNQETYVSTLSMQLVMKLMVY